MITKVYSLIIKHEFTDPMSSVGRQSAVELFTMMMQAQSVKSIQQFGNTVYVNLS